MAEILTDKKQPSKISDRTWNSRADFFKFVFIDSRMRQEWHSPFKLLVFVCFFVEQVC